MGREETQTKDRCNQGREGTVVAEKKRTLILLGTFMVAAGLLTGEASSVQKVVFCHSLTRCGTLNSVAALRHFVD